MRKRHLLLLWVALLTTLSTHAYDFQSGDLYYNITSATTVEVTYQVEWNEINYQGLTIATIPATVTYDGTTYSVTSIGNYAFEYCSSLTSVTIPNSVTSIGEGAFSDCSSLPVVNNLRYADTYLVEAVDNSLSTYTIKAGTKWIEDYAFYGCSSLTSITIPNSVTSIGDHAFAGCSSLPVVDNVRYADTYLVEAVDKSLSTYTIKAGTKWIGESAFSGCSSLTSLTIPNSVTSIGESAFSGCSSLTSVTIPNSVTSIGESAFSGCSSLTSLTIPNSVTSIGNYAFEYCSSLTSVTIPESVTGIGYYAFYDCYNLTSVTIPESVTYIGDKAFYNCSRLTSVTIGSGVEFVGADAFNFCEALTKTNYTGDIAGWCAIQWGNSSANPIYYSQNLFINDVEVKDLVIIPNSVTSIGGVAFYNCSGLTSVTIPDFVTSIGSAAFFGCKALTSVTIGNSVTSIGDYAFAGCSSLTSITIPNSVTSIGNYAFEYCSSLTSVTIPESVTSIGQRAFYSCYQVECLSVPNSVTEIGSNAFYNMPLVVYGGTATGSPWGAGRVISPSLVDGDLIFEDEAHTILAQCLTTAMGEIVIPSTVTTIRKEAFRDCTGLTAITIPTGVTTIESSAFYNCTGVISITIPESVTTIGTNAFSNVYNIQYNGTATGSPWGARTVGGYIEGYLVYDSEQKTAVVRCHTLATGSILLPQSLIAIEGEAFEDCKDITSINLPESLITIGAKAFSGCNNITSITIPKNVTTIGGDAFRGCTNMTSVVWNAKNCEGYNGSGLWLGVPIGTIGTFGQGLYGNEYITSFTFGPEVEKIPKYICYDMPNLTEIIIPESVKTIGACAFKYCTGLTSITIPTSVTRIEGDGETEIDIYQHGDGAFAGSGITSIIIPDSVTYLGIGTFKGCKNLKTATIGNGVTCFYNQMFYECTSLESVKLPDNLTTLGAACFEGCISLDSINLPNTLEYISSYAFSGCSGLQSITIPEMVTQIGSNAFYDCTALTSITCESVIPPSCYVSSSFGNCPMDLPVSVPCGGYDLYLASDEWSLFTNLQAPAVPYALSVVSNDPSMGSVSLDKTQQCAGIGYLTATPEFGYRFVQWNDGNTDNPRTFELTQDTTFVAEFALVTSGKCGDDLYWVYEDGKIRISGTGAMYDYTATTQPWLLLRDNLTEVTICNTATYLGTYAFAQAYSLASVSIGSSVWRIGANAFAGCTRLYHVYSYASYPPSAESSSFANYNVYVHVPCESVEDYELNALWGDFKYIKCMESDEVVVPNDEVSVSPDYEDATFTWPITESADTYSLVLTKNGETFCTLVFNAQGQLLSIAFKPRRQNAPAAEGSAPATYAEMTANGFRFKVTGLDEGSAYAYTMTVRDEYYDTLETYTGEFTTLSNTPTGVNESAPTGRDAHGQAEKTLRNGQVLILRDGKTYSILGEQL